MWATARHEEHHPLSLKVLFALDCLALAQSLAEGHVLLLVDLDRIVALFPRGFARHARDLLGQQLCPTEDLAERMGPLIGFLPRLFPVPLLSFQLVLLWLLVHQLLVKEGFFANTVVVPAPVFLLGDHQL